jgi:uncharacterized SAM-binding protein YcdF (DUF218 family)
VRGEEIARCANVVACWCAERDVSSLTREALLGEAGVEGGKSDLFVLFGGGVSGIVDELARAMRAGVARRYAIVGGRGHATYLLDRSFERELPDIGGKGSERLRAGVDSEAEMLDALLLARYGMRADTLETRSTNCGNNITFLMDLLEGEGSAPASVILCQDAVMQRRMGATWRRQAREREAFARTKVVCWAAYQAKLEWRDGRLGWRRAPRGIWPVDMYVELLSGEVARLTDDEAGYGPCGRDFLEHVDVPDEVREAAETLREALGTSGRPPDGRYA